MLWKKGHTVDPLVTSNIIARAKSVSRGFDPLPPAGSHRQFPGHTVDPMITSKIIARAKSVQTVLVTLDSGHDLEHDTKMSRWHSTGPLGAVKMFLEKHPEFEVSARVV
eukprot:gene28343-31467_t